MGKVCSCIKQTQVDKNQLEEEKSPEIKSKSATPVQRQSEISLGDLMKLQDVLRGYLDRRRAKEISRTKSIVMLFDNQTADRKVRFYKKSASTENEEKGILLNSIVENVEKKLGTFNCGNSGKEDLSIKRRPVTTNNGAIYTGDFNALNQYHGYGVLV